MKNTCVNWIATGMLVLATPAVYANVNLVNNGSFESAGALANGTNSASPGNCSVAGWTCTVPAGNAGGAGNNVGLWTVQYGGNGAFFGGNFITDPLAGFSPDPAGNDALYLVDDGTNGNPITETVSQNVTMVTGGKYNVGFDAFFVANSNGNPNPSTVSLSIDGGSALFTASTASLPLAGWTNFNYLYTATGSGPVPFTITYEGGTYTGQDLLVDRAYDVAVTSATPEPGFYGLTGAGLVGLLGVVRRRRQARQR